MGYKEESQFDTKILATDFQAEDELSNSLTVMIHALPFIES